MSLASSTIIPGVVVDPSRATVYIMRPTGGIDAVDTVTGRVRWTTARADEPLFVDDDVLLARLGTTAPGLLVTRLHAATGEPVAKAPPELLRLPEGVTARIDDTLAHSFRHSIKQRNARIELAWEYIERDVSGLRPRGARGSPRRETGTFHYFDGRFEAAQDAPGRSMEDDWPEELKTLLKSKRILRMPWKTPDFLAVAQQRADQLVLRRWRRDGGEPLPDAILFDGRALAVLGSADERHVAVSIPSGRPEPEPQYLLRYFALDSAELVAEVASERSVTPYCVLGSRLLRVSPPASHRQQGKWIERPLELVATEPGSGDTVWRRAIRDTAYRGSAPPEK